MWLSLPALADSSRNDVVLSFAGNRRGGVVAAAAAAAVAVAAVFAADADAAIDDVDFDATAIIDPVRLVLSRKFEINDDLFASSWLGWCC